MPTQELERMAAERMELAIIVGEVRSIETRIEKLISERPDVEVCSYSLFHLLRKLI